MVNKLLGWYQALPHDNSLGIFSKALNRGAAKALKLYLDNTVPNYFIGTRKQFKTVLNKDPRDVKITVSLTSFPARLENVWIVIECIFRQTYKVDRIVLWLDENLKDHRLPPTLVAQMDRGLEVRYVEDLRAHTKYYYALQEFKDDIVITVDDDCYYPVDTVENLMAIHQEYPQSIAANRIHGIVVNNNNEVVDYKNWSHNYKPENDSKLDHLLTGVSGVLYPPSIFNDNLFKREVLLDICKYADDVWLSLHARAAGISIKTNSRFNKDFISISKSFKVRLLNHNSKSGGNDVQVKAVLKYLNSQGSQNIQGIK